MRTCKPICACWDHELIITKQVGKIFHLCLQYCSRHIALEGSFHRQIRCTTRVSGMHIKNIPAFFGRPPQSKQQKERGPSIGNDAQSRPAIGIDCLFPRSYQRKRARFVSDVMRELAQIAKQGDTVDF